MASDLYNSGMKKSNNYRERGDSLFQLLDKLKESENFRVREKRTEIREITSLHHKSNTRRKFVESKQNTRVFDVKWRPNRFLDESRTNIGNNSRIHKNDNSNSFSRR